VHGAPRRMDPGPVRGRILPYLASTPWHNTKKHHEDSRVPRFYQTLWNISPFGAPFLYYKSISSHYCK